MSVIRVRVPVRALGENSHQMAARINRRAGRYLHVNKLLDTSQNAVKTQMWCAVSTNVVIAIVKNELQHDASLYTLLQILLFSVFEKTAILCALLRDPLAPETAIDTDQLNMFDT